MVGFWFLGVILQVLVFFCLFWSFALGGSAARSALTTGFPGIFPGNT